jgi:hypothetical protein
MTESLRLDQLSAEQIAAVQAEMVKFGFDPGPVDGIWGKRTARAYSGYITALARPRELVAPAPAKPWWQSRAVIGSLVAIGASAAGLAGWEIDGAALTEIVLQVLALAGAVLAWWGTVRRKGPIDPGAVLPGVRLPNRLPEHTMPPSAAKSARSTTDDDPLGHFRGE